MKRKRFVWKSSMAVYLFIDKETDRQRGCVVGPISQVPEGVLNEISAFR